VRFHYVAAGSGEPVVLPGWPESWIAWRKMIPLFVSAGRQVYVLDPRGSTETNHA
jgi:pimeloyl-ACP methyl ester carboxylesterase